MKTIRFISMLLVIIVAVNYSCSKDDEEEPVPQEANYNTVATINVVYPDIYSFGVTGTTNTQSQGNTFTSTSNFTMGQTTIPNVVVDGTIQNGQVTFTNKKFLLVFPILGGADTIREEVTFSTGPINLASDPITGTGNIVLRMIDDTTTERGTFTYTLTKVK